MRINNMNAAMMGGWVVQIRVAAFGFTRAQGSQMKELLPLASKGILSQIQNLT